MNESEIPWDGKLSLNYRVEGSYWVCDLVLSDEGEPPIVRLGTIQAKFVKDNPTLHKAFVDLMAECFLKMAGDVFGPGLAFDMKLRAPT
jgi:hypothetical protein